MYYTRITKLKKYCLHTVHFKDGIYLNIYNTSICIKKKIQNTSKKIFEYKYRYLLNTYKMFFDDIYLNKSTYILCYIYIIKLYLY